MDEKVFYIGKEIKIEEEDLKAINNFIKSLNQPIQCQEEGHCLGWAKFKIPNISKNYSIYVKNDPQYYGLMYYGIDDVMKENQSVEDLLGSDYDGEYEIREFSYADGIPKIMMTGKYEKMCTFINIENGTITFEYELY